MAKLKNINWFSSCLLGCLVVLLVGALARESLAQPKPKIKIGVIGPMDFLAGMDQWGGAVIAAEEINKAGGVKVGGKSYEIEVVKKDSNEIRNIDDAVRAIEELITYDKVNFITGGYRSEAVLAMQEVMADHKIPWVAAAVASPALCERLKKNYERYKYFFRNASLNSIYTATVTFMELDMVGNKVRKELGITKPRVALLVEKVLYTDPIVESLKKLCPSIDMEVVGVWRPSPTATDVSAELSAIKSAGAQIIYFMSAMELGIPVSKQWGELKIPAAPVGFNSMAMSDRHWAATNGMCNYEAAMSYYAEAEVTKKTKPFINEFKKVYRRTPTLQAITHDAIWVLKEGVERAGTLESDAVVMALEKTDFIGTIGRIKFYPKDHDRWPHDLVFGPGYVTSVCIQWRDGKQMVIWPDGRSPHPAIGAGAGWEGLKYPGTVDYKLPPWVIEYWKGKK